jgi:hypothetical protein
MTSALDIRIIPYTKELESEVVALNQRIRERGGHFQFPETSQSPWLPKLEGRSVYQDRFLAIDGTGTVRGGYLLRCQKAWLKGKERDVFALSLPLSEGYVDRAYRQVGHLILEHAIQRQPLLFALGMGSMNNPMPLALKKRGWNLTPVPFYFQVVRPYTFLRNISYLRRTIVHRIFLDFAACTGLGWLGFKAMSLVFPSLQPDVDATPELIETFSDDVDALWEQARTRFQFATVRDARTLNILYPPDEKRFLKLSLKKDGNMIGWAVTLSTRMSGHRQFGNLRVGSIVDCLCLPGHENTVIRAATLMLVEAGADIIVANQSYAPWCIGLKKGGFLRGPSNFLCAVSPELDRQLGGLKAAFPDIHVNRADGGGPINL